MKRLNELVKGVPCAIEGNSTVEVKGIAYNSTQVQPGFLFVAVEGFAVDGRQYIDDAINRGATIIATSDPARVRKNWVTAVQTRTPRRFLAQVANRYYDFPARKLTLVGVTGTNGKTTTTYLLRAMAQQAGINPGLVGTIEYWDGTQKHKAGQTTPESLDLVRMLARMVEAKVPLCVAEVSSHSLELDRVFDLDFKVAVFTNLTQDHLDFHRTMENYRAAKMRLFTGLSPTAHAVTNLDDAMGRDIPHETKARVITYGTRPDLEDVPAVHGRVVAVQPDGLACEVTADGQARSVRLRLIGRHNLANLLAAYAAGRVLGWDHEDIIKGASALEAVPGRLQPVPNSRGFGVFVDYAHTPDALKRVLATVREFTGGRVITVFGCGGDRDRAKRPLMGAVVAQLADLAIVTSDNPRSESPTAIIDEIVKGMNETGSRLVEPDRREAIRRAFAEAKPRDTVLIAGKGHEDYQIVGRQRLWFDDAVVAAQLLEELA
ncbi:MAG: UDP-N-acetylmuramoyl-L-alanyl-D-glutamate--2,6-diaminopimelate ligase [bacterium]